MEKARGIPLYSIWPSLSFSQRCGIVTAIAYVEYQLAKETLPSGGSLFFDKLSSCTDAGFHESQFEVGTSVDKEFFRNERRTMVLDRGPCKPFSRCSLLAAY